MSFCERDRHEFRSTGIDQCFDKSMGVVKKACELIAYMETIPAIADDERMNPLFSGHEYTIGPSEYPDLFYRSYEDVAVGLKREGLTEWLYELNLPFDGKGRHYALVLAYDGPNVELSVRIDDLQPHQVGFPYYLYKTEYDLYIDAETDEVLTRKTFRKAHWNKWTTKPVTVDTVAKNVSAILDEAKNGLLKVIA